MLLPRVEPHVTNIPADPPLDVTSVVGIGGIILVSLLLLIFVFVIRCRYLRRRNCSLCGQRVAQTGLERVEGFWQRIWHEGCWDKRMGLGGTEKGGGKGVMAELRSAPPSPRTHSAAASPLPSPKWKHSAASPASSRLPLPDMNAFPSTYAGPTTASPSSSRARFLYVDPYAAQDQATQTTARVALLTPPRSTSRHLGVQTRQQQPQALVSPRQAMTTIREGSMSPERPRPAVQHTSAVLASRAVINNTESAHGRRVLSDVPPRASSMTGEVKSAGTAI